MAKPLSKKSQVLREAIRQFPELGNTALAEKLNQKPEREQDALHFTPQDVSAQRMAMRKAGAPAPMAVPEKELPSYHEENGEPLSSRNGAGLTADDLRALVGLMRKAGGADRLVEVLEVIRSVSE